MSGIKNLKNRKYRNNNDTAGRDAAEKTAPAGNISAAVGNAAGADKASATDSTPIGSRRRRLPSMKALLLITALVITAVFAVRTAILLIEYPQVDIPVAEVLGENGENLSGLKIEGKKLYATSSHTEIAFDYTGDAPIRSVGFKVASLSRENCRSYVTLLGCAMDGNTIMKKGANYIDFEYATPASGTNRIVFRPLPVRGVSFRLLSFTINPWEHTVGIEVRNLFLFLMVILVFEGVLFELIHERKTTGRPMLGNCILIPAIQAVLGGVFVYMYYTQDWIDAAVIYHFAAFLAEGIFMLLMHMPRIHSAAADALIQKLYTKYKKKFIRPRRKTAHKSWGRKRDSRHRSRKERAAAAAGNKKSAPAQQMSMSATGDDAAKAAKAAARAAADAEERRREYKWELPMIRVFLLSVFDFAILEMLYSDMYRLDDPVSTMLNILIYTVPYVIMYAVFKGKKQYIVYSVPTIIWFFIALVNHYYFVYRAQAFELADLTMARTAQNVMGTYSLPITIDVFFAIAAFVLILLGIVTENHKLIRRKGHTKRIVGAVIAVVLVIYIGCNIPNVNLWNTNIATLHHGYIYSWFSFAGKTLEKPIPEGYSAEETEALLDSYSASTTAASGENGSAASGEEGSASSVAASEGNGSASTTAASGEVDSTISASPAGNVASSESTSGSATVSADTPNVIVIMDEAFADLPTTYDFETDVDDLPYIHSLEGSNVKKGWMMSSVFGGTTANTEYEFLTGNSVSFLGADSVPYTQYINSTQESLAWLLKDRGYSTTAFHPYDASGYKRYKVYPLLGFDTFHSVEDGLTYANRMRTYIDDDSDFKDLIEMFNNNDDGTPQFIFNVTMQNHGNYNSDSPAVDVTVEPTDEELQLAQVEEYLTLAHATDAAFEELTSYFSTVDEPTIILLFGDHQPGVSETTLRALEPEMYEDGASLEEKEKKYTVPYVMWANFDLPEGDAPEYISPNYLRSYLLECAGIEGSAYDKFVTDVRQEYPAVNILGYLDADGTWNDISGLDSESLLEDYKKAAYYNLFDHGKVKMDYFTKP